MTRPHSNGSLLDPIATEPLAVVGLSFEFPGGATTEDSFWKMLEEKQCVSSEFPRDRMNIDAFYSTSKPNTIHTKKAHFLDRDIREFDAAFFNIPPAEAGPMDPCQRGLMETTFHAMENAGIPLSDLSGTNTSVHVGCFSNDHMVSNLRDLQSIPKYAATGSAQSILANRISWFFNLQGPSVTVDTACSSSLTALDLACQGLWTGRSNAAIVGAANAILSPEFNVSLSNMNFVSPEGRCFSFDHRASGYARGEGFATLVIKPLSRALADRSNIRALIRAVASNQDGYTSTGITQPSKDGQVRLIRETYRRAQLDMDVTRFFEAHGAGTVIGDVIEARAIGESFHRSGENPLYIGAVKSNIGHLEGTSGLAGLVKAILAVEKGVIPPNTNFEALNPNIDDEFFHLKFPHKPLPWYDEIRRASVNSFGFGGSNVHCVLDDVSSYLRTKGTPLTKANPMTLKNITGTMSNGHAHSSLALDEEGDKQGEDASFTPRLFVFSASDQLGTNRQAQAHGSYFSGLKKPYASSFLSNYAYTLGVHRTHLSWRAFCVIDDPCQLTKLESLVSAPIQLRSSPLKLGFVFTGQGSQWFGMGRELFGHPVFRESIERSQTYLAELGASYSLAERLTSDRYAESIHEAKFSQIMTTSLQLALVDLLGWLRVKSQVVIGHSSGEIAAAYAAGYISHASAIKVSYYRGQLCSRLEEDLITRHGMAVVGLSRDEVSRERVRFEHVPKPGLSSHTITVSCINSPSNVTISGPYAHLDRFVAWLQAKQVFARILRVKLGYHSPQLEPIASEYLALLGTLSPGSPKPVIMVSSVTGLHVDQAAVCSGTYWVQNLLSPVNFLAAMRTCHKNSDSTPIVRMLDRSHLSDIHINTWLEVGPHSTLQGPLHQNLVSLNREREVGYVSALVRKRSAISSLLTVIGRLYCQDGSVVDLARATTLTQPKKQLQMLAPLPRYPFNHAVIHWEESSANKMIRLRTHADHDLLGTRVGDSNASESSWRFIIQEDRLPWIVDHRVNGSILYPAAGMLVMAIEAAKQLMEREPRTILALELSEISFPAPIRIQHAKEGVEVRIHMSATALQAMDTDYRFRIFICKPDGSQDVVCSGNIRGDYGVAASDVDEGREAKERVRRIHHDFRTAMIACDQKWEQVGMYRSISEETGIDYGPTFQALDDVYLDRAGQARATLTPYNPPVGSSSYTVHPTRLDGIFQLAFAALSGQTRSGNRFGTLVPTRASRMWISLSGLGHAGERREQVHANVTSSSGRSAIIDLKAASGLETQLHFEVDGLELTAVAQDSDSASGARYICSHVVWKVDLETLTHRETGTYCEAARRKTVSPVTWWADMRRMILQFGVKTLIELEQGSEAIVPAMERYAEWLRAQCKDVSKTDLVESSELSRLCEQVRPSARADMAIMVGRHLKDILLGRTDPLGLIFEDEDNIAALYQEMNETASGYDPMCCYLDALVHKTPNLKFLEIGAGTGSTTKTVLNAIGNQKSEPRFEEYVFTDISPLFLSRAQDTFSEYARMTYQTLHVEHDIEGQGFVQGAYDVVIADNVLHATKDLCATLANVRKLLKPGGKLIMKEVVDPREISVGFIFGLLPGWWLASEEERRMSPCIDEPRWDALLRGSKFSGTDLIFPDHVDERCHQWSVLVSTALGTSRIPSAPKAVDLVSPTFIVDKTSATQKSLAIGSFQALGLSCVPRLMTLPEAASLAESERCDFIFLSEIETPILYKLNEATLIHLQKLFMHARSFLWVRQGGVYDSPSPPEYAISDGLLRVARAEDPKASLISLALGRASAAASESIAKVFSLRKSNMATPQSEFDQDYREMDGQVCIPRLVRADHLDAHIWRRTTHPAIEDQIGDQRLRMDIRVPSLLDTIEFCQDASLDEPLAPTEVIVKVEAVGVNFKDCMGLLGRIDFDADSFGSECSGTVHEVGEAVTEFKTGDRVLACTLKAYRTYARASCGNVSKIPDDMEFTKAASIATVYCTAYYSLFEKARLKKGETILVHAAAGATGQAAVQLAQLVDADIIATVGSHAKKRLLIDRYAIPEDRILYSRDASFAYGVKRITGGRGVDVVLNSLSGRLLEASWNCIAPVGRFVEIGLKDAFAWNRLPMDVFSRGASFLAVEMAVAYQNQDGLCRRLMTEILRLFAERKLRTVYPLHVYPIDQAQQAFRLLQSGKSSGKIVLSVNRKASLTIVQGPNSRYELPSNATYVVAGGLGGIGLSMAVWLVQRGARNLMLISRSGPKDQRARDQLARMREAGVSIQCPICDIADIDSLRRTVAESSKMMPPIQGCIQAAMVLKDSSFSTMSIEDWQQCTRPKIQGTWNLHTVFPALDFMVILSSACGITGQIGQSNYAAGNTFQDALARYRVARGQKTISLDLGIVLGQGFVAENKHVMDSLLRINLLHPLTIGEVFALLDYYCNPLVTVSPEQSQVVSGLKLPRDVLSMGSDVPTALQKPLFRCLHQATSSRECSTASASESLSCKQSMLSATSLDEASIVALEAFRTKLCRVLGIPAEQMHAEKSLSSYGIDSLVGVELRNWVEKEMGADITVFEILGGATLKEIGRVIASKCRLRDKV